MATLMNAKFRLVETTNDYLVVDQDDVYWCRLDKRKPGSKQRCRDVCSSLIARQILVSGSPVLQQMGRILPDWEYPGD